MKPIDTSPPANVTSAPKALGFARVSFFATIAAVWGPGFLVMLADTDAGNIVTAAEAGARWGPAVSAAGSAYSRSDHGAGSGGPHRAFSQMRLRRLVREQFGLAEGLSLRRRWSLRMRGSLVTEFTGIAGVGELYGASRAFRVLTTRLKATPFQNQAD